MCADWLASYLYIHKPQLAYIMGGASPNDACSAPLGADWFRKVAYILD